MNKTMKVAKWEIKRNLKNKSFLISLFLTPLIFIIFAFIGNLVDGSEDAESLTTVYIHDELGAFPLLEETAKQLELDFDLKKTSVAESEVKDKLKDSEYTAYIFLTKEGLDSGVFPVYTSEEMEPYFEAQIQAFSESIKSVHIGQLGLSEEQLREILKPFVFK